MKRLAYRWAAAVGLLLAAVPSARADLVLSIEPAGVTSMGFFHVMLTNTDTSGTRYIEGVNVALTLGAIVDQGGGNFMGLGTNAATITAALPPQFSQVNNTPPFPLFVSNDPANNFFGFPDNPADPLFPGSAGFFNNLGAGEQVFALGAGQTVQVGFFTYDVNVIPNGSIVLPISILPSTSITEATGPGNVGDNTIINPTFPAPNGPLQIGSVFIPEPASVIAFAGLIGMGAVAVRRRRRAA